MSHLKKKTLYVKGMHCASCDVLIHDKLGEVPNIKDVKANHQRQTAEVCYVGTLSNEELNKKINQYGYSLVDKEVLMQTKEPLSKRLFDAGVITLLLFFVFYFAQEFNLVPSFNAASSLSLAAVFVLGLVASTSSCMATSGALFLATVGSLQKKSVSFTQNILPAVLFNLGRIISYGIFGFIVGFFGKSILSINGIGPYLSLFVSFFMIIIGLNMLQLISFDGISSNSITKGLFTRIKSKLITHPKQSAFLLGAITYLLPCGFTQSVQLYALGLADPIKSAGIMMVFALGTMPMLIAIGFASSFTKASWYPVFSKFIGVVIVMIGLVYLSNFLSLRGISLPLLNAASGPGNISSVEMKDGFQIIKMDVNSRGYSPNVLTVQSGIPVKWVVNGQSIIGCQSVLQAPQIGVQKNIALGENIIEFTPKEKGQIHFSCSMGMYNGVINVI